MISFLSACGATVPLTLEVAGPGLATPAHLELADPFALIGRDDRAAVVLDHAAVSRRHAYLQVIDGRVFVVDLGSRAGTLCGGQSVEARWLAPGESLSIGPYEIRLVSPPDPAAAPAWGDVDPAASPLLARPAGANTLPPVSLEFRSLRAGRSVWIMNPVLALVGSSPRCNVRLSDSDVSRFHCAVLRTPQGLWVVDLLGREGVTVNSARVRSAPLRFGEVLGLGRVMIRPRAPDEESRTDPGANLPEIRANAWQPPAPVGPGGAAPNHALPARVVAGQFPDGPDPSLSLLLSHFGQMQQQMLDQFQQSMMMMMQMFGGMHRDQMGLVREELEKLGELKEEFASIKAQLAARPGPAPAPPPPSLPPLPPFVMPPWRPAGPPPAPVPPAGAEPQPVNGRPQAGAPPVTPDPEAAGPMKTVVSPPDLTGDTHDWLNQRLSMIEAEQANRWQKIMGFLKGGSKS